MRHLDAIESLLSTTGKKEKSEILSQNSDDAVLRRILIYLTSTFQTSGISNKKLSRQVEPQTTEIDNIVDLLDYITTHKTGDDQTIAIVQSFLYKCNERARSIYQRLIVKDLPLGVSDKTVNKHFINAVPVFDVQLAFPYEKKIDKYTDDELIYVTQKLDGYRGLSLITPKQVDIFSRKGQPITGLTQLSQDILSNASIRKLIDAGLVLDGELIIKDDGETDSGELFRKTSKALRKDGEKVNIELHIFDILPLSEFQTQDQSNLTYRKRRELLDTIEESEYVKVVPVLAIINKSQIPEMAELATDHGWEGVMLNRADGYYRKTRSADILKVKQMHTADLPIVGYNVADSGRFAGQLQSINVQLDENNIVQVGSGLTDEVRQEIWDNQEKYLGTMVEIQYFELTENQDGGKSLRFPVFKAFRPDKDAGDTNVE